jgi:hypothetical protein
MPNTNLAVVPYSPRNQHAAPHVDGNARIHLYRGGAGNLSAAGKPLSCHVGTKPSPPFVHHVNLPNGHRIWVKPQDAAVFPNHAVPRGQTAGVHFQTSRDHRNSGGNLAVNVGGVNFDASSAANAAHDTPVRMPDGKTLFMSFADSLRYDDAYAKANGHLDVFEDKPADNFIIGMFTGNGRVMSQARPFTVSIAVTGAAAIVSGVGNADYEARDLKVPPFVSPIIVPNRGTVYVRAEDARAFQQVLTSNGGVVDGLNQTGGPRGTSRLTITLKPR